MITFIKKQILGWILDRSNSNVNHGFRDYFYSIKTDILRKYGKFKGLDFQYIEKKCWNCGGTGRYGNEKCYRCDNGLYSRFWVILERYKLGSYYFHIPVKRSHTVPPTILSNYLIRGYIQKTNKKFNKVCLFILMYLNSQGYFKIEQDSNVSDNELPF